MPQPSSSLLATAIAAIAAAAVVTLPITSGAPGRSALAQEFPKPALYPTSWELDFQPGIPQRIVIEIPGKGPQAFWYLTYTVTNNTDQEQTFLPVFEMLTNDGQVLRSDRGVPAVVFDRIKERERKQFLEPFHRIGGTLLVGEDQARDGVAIWPEPPGRMGRFSIFVEGLSGETATVKIGNTEEILRKELQLNYHLRGDEVYRGEDELDVDSQRVWVMR
jgi:hypothetical protein